MTIFHHAYFRFQQGVGGTALYYFHQINILPLSKTQGGAKIIFRIIALDSYVSFFRKGKLNKIYTLVELGLDHGSDRITLTDC